MVLKFKSKGESAIRNCLSVIHEIKDCKMQGACTIDEKTSNIQMKQRMKENGSINIKCWMLYWQETD